MEISFRTIKLEKIFNDYKKLVQEYGLENAKKISLRMAVLQNALCLNDIPKLPPDRCHELSGERKGEFAVDIKQPRRLIFKPAHEPIPYQEDGSIDLRKITKVQIIEVGGYHI
ncbi:MAG: hypothetical protein A2096_14415 [Spirochaetes bacterium GWF1_41_5]|nr:MAG: hypothetical protein A2096_14415 [Spirochaetes bacterium GWF1_41_5]HBE01803.1 killer suppression protein [Spirochaetia bacterium]